MLRANLALGRRIVSVTGVLGLLGSALPARAQICTPFTDVPASNIFCSNIQWMLNRGVTSGCGTNLYCPSQFMPRDQMAAFMNRLADKVVFQQGGNAFAAAGELGTTDNQALEVIVNNSRVMRYEPNAISPNVIGGSPANNVTAGVRGATIGGGGVPLGADPEVGVEGPNRVSDIYGTVGGGLLNLAGDDAGSTTDRWFATVAGGYNNKGSGTGSTVAGGSDNTASGAFSTVAGGKDNTASVSYSTVAGGQFNTASGPVSTVAGGEFNRASGGYSTVAGGFNNMASGPVSAVAGGDGNTASGAFSFAAGRSANAQQTGCHVWSDGSSANSTTCFGANEFIARAVGGFYFITAGSSDPTYTGASLLSGAGAWGVYSDRDGKRDFELVDPAEVLAKVVALPISTWQWKAEADGIRHMGPTAQDFRAAFALGRRETEIVTVDADGVALAAIQGLNAKLEAKIADQAREIASLRAQHTAEIAELRRAFELLVARLGSSTDMAASR